MEQQSSDKFSAVTFKDGRVFMIKLMGGHKARTAFNRLLTVITPILGVGGKDLYNYSEQAKAYDESLESEESDYVELPELSIEKLAGVVTGSIAQEEFEELQYILLDDIYQGFTKSEGVYQATDTKVDLDKDLQGELDIQLILLEESFKANLSRPLVSWLDRKGFSEIGSGLSSMMSVLKSAIATK